MNKDFFIKVYEKSKEHNVIETLLVFFSILSVNFASYIIYFDVNALMIIDSTAITKHFFGVVVLYAIVSASVSILLLFLQNLVLVIKAIPVSIFDINLSFLELKKEHREAIQTILENKYVKYMLITIIFCFVYVGIEATIFISLLCLVYIVAIKIFIQKFKDEDSEIEKTENDYNIPERISLIAFFGLDRFIWDAVKNFEKGEYLNFIISKVGILLLLFSFSLGVGRAIFVKEHIHVKLNSEPKNYVLYLTTSGGIGLFDIIQKEVRFTSWGNIKKLIFINEKRRSFGTLFDSNLSETKR